MQKENKLSRGPHQGGILPFHGARLCYWDRAFYGSAAAIEKAGPAVLLFAYLIGGAAVFMVMRALGEMAVHHPVAGSFSQYASHYMGPLAGF